MAGRKPSTEHGRMVKLTIAFPQYVIDEYGLEQARQLIREVACEDVARRRARRGDGDDLGPDAA